MQRDYVWTPAKLVSLLDSLYKKWPIGSFYLWRTHTQQRSKVSPHASKIVVSEFFGYLLDGQQRLVSLSRAIRDPSDGELDYCAFFDLLTEGFVTGAKNKTVQKRIERGDPTLVSLFELVSEPATKPTEHMLRISNLIEAIKEYSTSPLGKNEIELYRARLTQVGTMLEVSVPCEVFEDDHVANAIELFARLNRGGTKLSSGDVEAAKLSQEATSDVLPLMREFVQDQRMRQLGLDFLFVLRALITVHRDNCSFAKLPNKWATSGKRDLLESWESVTKALETVIDILASDLGWTTKRWLPSANALIPILYYLASKPGKFSQVERKALLQFLMRASVRSLFSGAVETAINRYVNVVSKSRDEGRVDALSLYRAIPKVYTHPITPEQIRTERRMYSPLMQVYLAYLISKGSRSWISMRPLFDIARGDVKDPLSVHHIFPKEFLQKQSIDISQINCMANYAILAQSDNSALGETHPRDGYNKLTWDQRKEATEQLCFHADDKFLTIEAYDEYLHHRSRELAKRLNTFLGFC
jgi:hypothetical protein